MLKRKACYLASYYKLSISIISDEIQAAPRKTGRSVAPSPVHLNNKLPWQPAHKKPKLLRIWFLLINFLMLGLNMHIHVRRVSTHNQQHSFYFSMPSYAHKKICYILLRTNDSCMKYNLLFYVELLAEN